MNFLSCLYTVRKYIINIWITIVLLYMAGYTSNFIDMRQSLVNYNGDTYRLYNLDVQEAKFSSSGVDINFNYLDVFNNTISTNYTVFNYYNNDIHTNLQYYFRNVRLPCLAKTPTMCITDLDTMFLLNEMQRNKKPLFDLTKLEYSLLYLFYAFIFVNLLGSYLSNDVLYFRLNLLIAGCLLFVNYSSVYLVIFCLLYIFYYILFGVLNIQRIKYELRVIL